MGIEVDRWIVCISGYMQSEARLSGIEQLQHKIHTQCSSPTTRVLLKSWRDSPDDLAERIWRSQPHHPPGIVVIGYSYGGCTAIALCEELERRGLDVEHLLLLDAVWRPWHLIPSLLSLLKLWVLKVPSNVGTCYSWTQTLTKPSGHTVQVDRDATTLHRCTLNVGHQYVDEHPVAHECAMRVACPDPETERTGAT